MTATSVSASVSVSVSVSGSGASASASTSASANASASASANANASSSADTGASRSPSPRRGEDQGGGCVARQIGLRALTTLTLLALGCAADPPDSCSDHLGGIWEAAGRRYHVIEAGGAIEIFALADSRGGLDRPLPGAARSASYARLQRDRERLSGYGQQFRAEGDRVCRVRWPIAGRCAAGALELEIAEPGAVDFTDCSQSSGGDARPLAMRRVREL